MADDTTIYNDDNEPTLQGVTTGGDIKNVVCDSDGHLIISVES